MADAINHDVNSKATNAAWSTAKWGLLGLAAAIVAPIAVGAGTVGAVVALAGSHAVLATFAGLLGAAATVLTAGVSWGAALPLWAVGGAAYGLSKTGDRVGAEKQAYRDRTAIRQGGREAELASVAQNAYMAGAQAGASHVVEQIQQQMQQPSQVAEPMVQGKFTANCKTKCDTKVEALVQDRAQSAAAGNQIG